MDPAGTQLERGSSYCTFRLSDAAEDLKKIVHCVSKRQRDVLHTCERHDHAKLEISTRAQAGWVRNKWEHRDDARKLNSVYHWRTSLVSNKVLSNPVALNLRSKRCTLAAGCTLDSVESRKILKMPHAERPMPSLTIFGRNAYRRKTVQSGRTYSSIGKVAPRSGTTIPHIALPSLDVTESLPPAS